MLAYALWFVARHGSNVPFVECWLFMPVLSGQEPVTTGWLWERMYEHRFPVTRLMILALFRLTHDMRAAMFFNVVALGVAAVALIRTAERLRGRPSYTDAFFPLALLHVAQWECYLWHGMITITAPVVLIVTLLLVILRGETRLSRGSALAVGVCLILLPLCGGWGLIVVPVLLPWLGYLSWAYWYPAGAASRRNTWLLGGFTLAACLLIGVYFLGWTSGVKTSSSPVAMLRTTGQVLSIAIGPTARTSWPYATVLLVVLFLTSLAILAWAALRERRGEAGRLLGLALFMLLMVVFALAISRGRSAEGGEEAGFQGRYICLAVLWLCGAYFIGERYSPPLLRGLLSWSLLTLAAVLVVPNTRDGLAGGGLMRQQMQAFEENLHARLPLSLLVKQHAEFLYSESHVDPLVTGLSALHRAGLGPFALLRDDSPFQVQEIPVRPAAVQSLVWKELTGKGTGKDSWAEFALDAPRYVCAIQLVLAVNNPEQGPSDLRISWQPGGPEGAATWETKELKLDAQDGTILTVWVCAEIERFRIHPDIRPHTITLSQMSLVVPAETPSVRD